jgi:hypothetical protein
MLFPPQLFAYGHSQQQVDPRTSDKVRSGGCSGGRGGQTDETGDRSDRSQTRLTKTWKRLRVKSQIYMTNSWSCGGAEGRRQGERE